MSSTHSSPFADRPMIAILAENGFDPHTTANICRQAARLGFTPRVIAAREGLVESLGPNSGGIHFEISAQAGEADVSAYAALVIPGGKKSIAALAPEDTVRGFIAKFLEAELPVLALGEGAALVALSTTKSLSLASSDEVREAVPDASVTWLAEALVQDGRVLSASPDASDDDVSERFAGLLAA